MTEQEQIDAIDETYRSHSMWHDFLDRANDPVSRALKIARSANLGDLATGMLASQIVGAMLGSYRAGVDSCVRR